MAAPAREARAAELIELLLGAGSALRLRIESGCAALGLSPALARARHWPGPCASWIRSAPCRPTTWRRGRPATGPT